MLNIQKLCIAEMVQLREAGKVQTASSAQLPQVCISLPLEAFLDLHSQLSSV